MDDKHRALLRRHWSELRRDLEPKKLFPYMVNVLDESDEQEIKAKETREEQVDKMLEILPRRGPHAFESFARAVETTQPFLACPLIRETELEEMRTELHKVRCHSARLREEICTVKGQLDGERSKQERTRKELEELKSMHHALLKQSKNERLHFELKIKELKKENVTLKTELAQEKDDKEMFSSEVKRLQDLCDAMHENLKTQEKHMSELKKQHRNTEEENDKFIGQLGKFSVDIEHVFDRKESTGGRKRHSREEMIPSFIGIASEMSRNCVDSDESKENLECLTGNREGDLVESLYGTSPLEAKREIEELISKTLKEKDEAVARCMELELLLQKAQVRQLEMKRKTSLRDRGTSFGDVPEDMNGQGEEAPEDFQCTNCKDIEEVCASLKVEKDKVKERQEKLEEELEQATKRIRELKGKHQIEIQRLELEIENLKEEMEKAARNHANEIRSTRVEMTEQHLKDVKDIQDQKLELSDQIEKDKIELNRLKMDIEKDKAKVNKQRNDFDMFKKKLNAEKKQLKNKLEQEVKARKKEASDLAEELEENERQHMKLRDEISRLHQSLGVEQDTIEQLKEEILRWKTLPGKVFNFRKEFDRNGVIYALGTNFATSPWVNPASANASPLRITVTRSSHDQGHPIDLLEIRKGSLSCTKDEERSWWCVDLGRDYALFLTHYTLRHGRDNGLSVIRHWRLEGSLDGRSWRTLKNHENDRGLKGSYPFYTGTWSIDGQIAAMRYFRIFQTGKNSSGRHGLYLSGLELYGVLLELEH